MILQQEVKHSAKLPALWPWIGISVVAHALLAFILLQQNSPSRPNQTEQVIKARLWIPPPITAPLPPEPTEKGIEAEPLEEPAATMDIATKPTPPKMEKPALQPVPEVNKTEVVDTNVVEPKAPVAEAESAPEAGKVLGGTSEHMSMAQRHLRGWQTQQQQQVAEQAARQFRQQRENPIGDIPDFSERLSEDEKRMQALMVEANCDSTGNKVAAVLMGIAGGMVKCSKPPPVKQFIDARLKRHASQSSN